MTARTRAPAGGTCAASMLGTLVLLTGCLAQHEPTGSDTATNWLVRCDRQADCRGAASCVEQRCTLACSPGEEDACQRLDSAAQCEPASNESGVCDLPCSADDACAALGPRYACFRGYCRLESEIGRAETELAPPRNLDAPFTLSDPDMTVARGPVAGWTDDHWTVTWSSGEVGYTQKYPAPRSYPDKLVPSELHVADVSESGAVSLRAIALNEQHELRHGHADEVAMIASPSILDGPECALRLVTTPKPSVSAPFTFACPSPGNMAAAPLMDSDDWLVAWSTGYTGQRSDVLLARYRPGGRAWLAGPWTVVSEDVHGWISLGVAGEDAWLAWPSGGATMLSRVDGVAGARVVQTASTPQIQMLAPPLSMARYAFAPTPDGALMFYTDGTSLQAVRAHADGVAETSLVPTSQGTGTSTGNKLDAVRIPEAGLTAVCYPQSVPTNVGSANKISVVTVDDEGQLVAGPVAASDEARSLDCAIAWSGSALLVAWLDMALYMAPTDYSMIRARIMPLP